MKNLWLLPCLAMMLSAADISGKWTGNVEVADPDDGSTVNTAVRAEFTQKGDQISGAVGRQEEQESEPIQNVKLEGNRLTFDVTAHEASATFKFVLTLEGNSLDGEMSGTLEGQPLKGKVHLTRAPAS